MIVYNLLQDLISIVPIPMKANQVALIDVDKATIVDIKNKRVVRDITRWGGSCTKDGKYGLYAPTRLENFISGPISAFRVHDATVSSSTH